MQVDDKELFDDAEEVDCNGDDDLLGGLLGGGEGSGEDYAGGECERDLETAAAAAAPPCWDVGCCSVRLLEWADSLEKLDGRRGPLESKSGERPLESRGGDFPPATATAPEIASQIGGLAASSSSRRGEKVAAVVVAPGEGELRLAADATAAAAATPSSLPPSTMGANEAEILRRRDALPPPGPMPPGIPDSETFPVLLGNEVMVSQHPIQPLLYMASPTPAPSAARKSGRAQPDPKFPNPVLPVYEISGVRSCLGSSILECHHDQLIGPLLQWTPPSPISSQYEPFHAVLVAAVVAHKLAPGGACLICSAVRDLVRWGGGGAACSGGTQAGTRRGLPHLQCREGPGALGGYAWA